MSNALPLCSLVFAVSADALCLPRCDHPAVLVAGGGGPPPPPGTVDPVPHFQSKLHVEEALKASGLPYTILRPVAFMDNFIRLPQAAITAGKVPGLTPAARSLKYIAVSDIGRAAAVAFGDASTWTARTVSLVHCTPVSGRTHRLRVHLRSVGLPIVGDDLYGRERALYGSMEELHAASAVPARAKVIDGVAARAGLKLHAWRLHVPATVVAGGAGGEPVVITANPPAELVACADFYGVDFYGVDLPPRAEGGG